MIENTSNRDPLLHLLGAMSDGSGGYVEGMEAAGQRQLLESCDLPTDTSGTDEEFLKLGFTFGEPHQHDPLFRPATLPEGWKREGTDHAMHSKILDEFGRERVGVFYKAAFYDRRADMHLNTVFGYVSNALYYGTEPILDDEWATVEAATEAICGYIGREQESIDLWKRPDVSERQQQYAAERVAEAKANIAKAEALLARVTS